jgi:hypothetical protein
MVRSGKRKKTCWLCLAPRGLKRGGKGHVKSVIYVLGQDIYSGKKPLVPNTRSVHMDSNELIEFLSVYEGHLTYINISAATEQAPLALSTSKNPCA